MKKKSVLLTSLMLLFALALTGCLGATTEPTEDITGVEWQWQSATNEADGTVTTVANPTAYTVTFNDDGTVSGQADCNQFNGSYTQVDAELSIQLGPMTLAACGEASLDQQFLELLGRVAELGPEGPSGLTLYTTDQADRLQFSDGSDENGS